MVNLFCQGECQEQVYARVYHLNQQPWYTSYELPQYVVAYVWVNAKKIEYLAKNCGHATIFKVLMENCGFYNGGKSENFEIPFLARTIYQYWSRVYQKMWNSIIWGGMFSKKSWFCLYFHEKIMILDFLMKI